jgi:YHS domain-containing protein
VKLTIGLTLAIAAIWLSQSVLADDKSAHEDELMIAAQKICPVSGEALGEMGAPFKTKVGDQTYFLCCKDCVGKEFSKENLQKVTANLIAAQGECPVSGKPLPKDAPSVVVNDRQIFVCCKNCPAKVQADPAKYIAKVDSQLEKNLRDQLEKKQ